MPTAGSSRRKAKREPSDVIEEHDPSQTHRDDVDEDSDSQPRRRAKKEKKSKARRASASPEPAIEEDEEDEDERIDVENFRDQPLDRSHAAKLDGIAKDWETLRKNIHAGTFSLVQGTAMSMAETLEGDEAMESLTQVDEIMRNLLNIDHEMKSHEETLKEMYQKIIVEEPIDNAMERYDNGLKQRIEDFNSKTSRQKYASSNDYVKFKQGVFETQNPDMAIPPINAFIPKEDGDESDDDDDLEIGGVTQDYKCPISLTLLVNPMASRVCNHSFSAVAIREYLGRATKPCPATGCNAQISMNDVHPDRDLEKKVRLVARRAQREQDDSDAEVIE